MKKLLFLILLTGSIYCEGQNYQCLQAGVRHYFTNSDSYLRGMRVDSVHMYADSTVYYPFHTPRGAYAFGATNLLDSNGGSWLGKAVVQKADGTFLFDNLWHDTVVIKTQAAVGDSWIFFHDSSARYYRANLTAMDTMTIGGVPDSIKKITITAYDDTGYVPADPLNNLEIMLSKNNGFAEVCDLFTFPYHRTGHAYASGDDYYLDYLVRSSRGNPTTFKLTMFINPTHEQLYDWNVGDVFENSTYDPSIYNTYPFEYYVDTITGKTMFTDSVQYSFNGRTARQDIPGGPPVVFSQEYPYHVFTYSGSFTIPNKLLVDTSLMPEEAGQLQFIYYFPNDASHCLHSALYTLTTNRFYSRSTLTIPIEGEGPTMDYKTGIGLLHYFDGAMELAPSYATDTTLLYYSKSGTPCGTYFMPVPSAVNDPVQKTVVLLYPNPATDVLTIKTASAMPYTITMQNMVGQTLQSIQATSQEQTLNIANLPTGVYNVTVTEESGTRYNERVVVTH